MRLLMILGLSTFLAFLTLVASAATPIFYDETIDGPLPIHSDPRVSGGVTLSDFLFLDTGINVFTGTARWDWNREETTADTAPVILPSGLSITSITFAAGNVQGTGWLANLKTALSAYDAGVTTRFFVASSPYLPVPFGDTPVFLSDLPVVTPRNYSVGISAFNGGLSAGEFVTVDYTIKIVVGVSEVMDVEFDIKPGSDPNSINPSLDGDLPVAILGSDDFDVADVDVATLTFGRGNAQIDHSHGPHFEDLDSDGLTDLMVHFRIEETEIAFGDIDACITGETQGGVPFKGCDAVRTVPDMDGDSLLDTVEATLGTDALNPDTDEDGFEDGQEVILMGTDPLDPMDPVPDPVPEPASWLMLVAGSAFLGVLYRRRVR